jgi:DNA (cytosine-5)-methyltransferase 1
VVERIAGKRSSVTEIVDFLSGRPFRLSQGELATVTHAISHSALLPNMKNPFLDDAAAVLGSRLSASMLERGGVHFDVPFPPPRKPDFRFVDLFAGIGGMRLAFQEGKLNGGCVYTSEWDRSAQQTYFSNFGEVPFGDITAVQKESIPNHEILVAGFPCQAFSIAGRRGGFEDTRGTLFFDVAETLKVKEPKAFLLENVKGLVSHDRGKTLETIMQALNELGYHVPAPQIINARDYGVAQNRERILIVGFKSRRAANAFSYPKAVAESKRQVIRDIKEENPVSVRYYLSAQYLHTLREHRKRHEEAGHGFGYEVLSDAQVANAIVVGGMGRERNLIVDKRLKSFIPETKIKGEVNREGIRRMTPREWARLQGFPDSFDIPVADAQAYKQFGNSVAVPAIRAVARQIVRALE